MIKKFFKKISMKQGTFLRYLLLNFALGLADSIFLIVLGFLGITVVFFGEEIFKAFSVQLIVGAPALFLIFLIVLVARGYAIEAINEKLKEIL